MDNIKNIVTGGVITLFVGGAAFTFSQQDVIDNFSDDTGLTQEQAEQYINDIPEDEMVSWSEVGSTYIRGGEETLAVVSDIDCVNFEYEWESTAFTCSGAKNQLQKIASIERSLGLAYIQLDSDAATEDDMRTVIRYLDQMNSDYDLEASTVFFDGPSIAEVQMTNSYNKSLLKTALESD